MKKKVALAILLSLVLFLGADAEERIPGEEEELERGGWAVSGNVVSFSALDKSSIPSPSGRLVLYRAARMVHDLEMRQDTLWIATEGGLFAYGVSSDSVAYVEGPISGSVYAIEFDDTGSLWVGGRNGLSIRTETAWLHFTPEVNGFFSRVTDISLGEERVWLSTYGNGAGFVEKGKLTIYTRRDSLLDDRVSGVLEQGAHTVWFGTASGLCRADTLQWQSMRYGSRMPIGAVRDLLIDEEGNIFLAIANRGVAVYNLGRIRIFGPGRGLPEHDVNAFSLDPFGKVWAAGMSGLSTFDGSGWIPYRLAGIPVGRYNFLSIHHGIGGDCYLGTDEGTVLILSRETVKEVVLPQGFTENTIARLHAEQNSIWCVGVDHVYRLGDTWERIDLPDEHFGGALTDVAPGQGDELWITSRFGLLRFDDSSWEVFDRRQGLPTEHFTRVARDRKGHLWFGTYDKGVLRLTGDTWIHYSENSGLADSRIEDLIIDRRGVPWIATGSGVVARFSDGEWEGLPLPFDRSEMVSHPDSAKPIEPYIRFLPSGVEGEDFGSASTMVSLGLDGLGNCMVASSQGIYRFIESEWQVIAMPESSDPLRCTAVLGTTRGQIWLGTEGQGLFVRGRGGWIKLGAAGGLGDEYIESLCEDKDGRIWIGTRFGGLAKFSPGPDL